jgi:hypothetical protein
MVSSLVVKRSVIEVYMKSSITGKRIAEAILFPLRLSADIYIF